MLRAFGRMAAGAGRPILGGKKGVLTCTVGVSYFPVWSWYLGLKGHQKENHHFGGA